MKSMTKEQIIEMHRPQKETWSPFRSLENYKAVHAKVAESKGRAQALKDAKTLTTARKVCYGNVKA